MITTDIAAKYIIDKLKIICDRSYFSIAEPRPEEPFFMLYTINSDFYKSFGSDRYRGTFQINIIDLKENSNETIYNYKVAILEELNRQNDGLYMTEIMEMRFNLFEKWQEIQMDLKFVEL
jgi:hypothetical protein